MRIARGILQNRRLINRRFVRLIADWVDHEDDWAFEELDVEPYRFGSRYDFWHYLDGESRVSVASVTDVCEWLVQCGKVGDLELFRERDYWQHPATFEQLRHGDCEDHALWAWRKLGELGIPAHFVIGRWRWDPDDPRFHAWVTYQDGTGLYLLEGVAKDVSAMIRPVFEVKDDYKPHLSVGHRRETRMYAGYLDYHEWKSKNPGPHWKGRRFRPLVNV